LYNCESVAWQIEKLYNLVGEGNPDNTDESIGQRNGQRIPAEPVHFQICIELIATE
jgi:hypothetical protein